MSLTEKNSYWTRIVENMEKRALMRYRQQSIRKMDYSLTLPKNLRKRVMRIIPYEFDEFDKNVFIEESEGESIEDADDDEDEEDEDAAKEKKKKKELAPEEFNESSCSDIERMEREFQHFELKLDKPLEKRAEQKKKHNWTSAYVCKQRKQRVVWDSKIYNLESNIWEKTLDEQAEQLMDASAERFTTWLNSLSTNREYDLTKEKLKSLFSVGGDRKLLASIQTDPTEVHAIAKTVADRWNMPEMAIELKYENYIKNRIKNVPKKVIKVAFGRTIPEKDRPWIPSEYDDLEPTVFPEELLSLEKLFKGITHLRSTHALGKYYKSHPDMERPRYLVKSGLFREKTKTETVADVPLYEKLKLKY